MTHEAARVDISDMPELSRLARQVQEFRSPCVLEQDGEPVALLVPAGGRRRGSVELIDTSALPPVPHRTVAELAGFAGSLPRPLSWDEITAIVDEEEPSGGGPSIHERPVH
jgi:antitoxin (DNA-binding transcriptional repressor) of toxin-antitoxin stability system